MSKMINDNNYESDDDIEIVEFHDEIEIKKEEFNYDTLIIAAKNGNCKSIEEHLEKMDYYEMEMLNEVLAIAAENGNKELTEYMSKQGLTNFGIAIMRAKKAKQFEIARYLEENQQKLEGF